VNSRLPNWRFYKWCAEPTTNVTQSMTFCAPSFSLVYAPERTFLYQAMIAHNTSPFHARDGQSSSVNLPPPAIAGNFSPARARQQPNVESKPPVLRTSYPKQMVRGGHGESCNPAPKCCRVFTSFLLVRAINEECYPGSICAHEHLFGRVRPQNRCYPRCLCRIRPFSS
jgi:hypothetical protein